MASVEQSNSNILSTDEKKVGLFGWLESRYVWCKMNSISKNSQWNMLVGLPCCLMMLSLMKSWILLSNRRSCRRMSTHQFIPWSSSTHWVMQEDDLLMTQKKTKQNEVFGVTQSKIVWLRCLAWPLTGRSCSKTLQCVWIKQFCKEELAKVIWKAHRIKVAKTLHSDYECILP